MEQYINNIGAVFALAAVGCAWAAALYFIPKSLASRFRYRLWRIRDETVDAILTGDLPEDLAIYRLAEAVQSTINNADDVRLSVWLFRTRPPDSYVAESSIARERYLNRLSEHQRGQFRRLEEQFRHAFFGHMMIGSPSGWLALTCLILVAIPFVVGGVGAKLVSRPIRTLFRESYYCASKLVVSPKQFIEFSDRLTCSDSDHNGHLKLS